MSQDLQKRKQPASQGGRILRETPAPRGRSRAAIPDWEEPVQQRKRQTAGSRLPAWLVRTRRKLRHIQRRWHHIVREMRRHNFPESERTPILLVLFAWNMLPMLGSLLREKT